MGSLKTVTREGILAAIAECEQIGKEAFLAKYGFAASAKYVLRHGGKSYPSKAIIGAAAKLGPRAFSGGRAHLGKTFAKLGFSIGALAFVATTPRVVSYAAAAHGEESTENQVETVYFASGSNTPDQIRGFSAIGQALGVAHCELTANGENALHALAGTGLPIFVDSGAFSEVEFGPEGPRVVAPITETQWAEILNTYARLAATLGRQLFVVAPDQVGFQAETLGRLERWAPEVRALIASGANVLVAMQKGPAMTQAEFYGKAVQILGTTEFVTALPCNKNATTVEEIAEFCAKVKPKRMHLLGLGLRNGRTPEAARVVAETSPETVLSLDSCLICESVGRNNGRVSHPAEKAKGPRVFTAAKDIARKMIAAGKSLLALEELAIHLAWGEDQLAMC